MRVLVCGGRDYDDEPAVVRALVAARATFVIDGGAPGADTLAWKWAKRHLAPDCRRTFDAEWHKHGKGAGPMRNQQMLDEGRPDLVIAFPGGRGTADMVRRAERAGVPVQRAR